MGGEKTLQQKWGKTMWKSGRNNLGKWEVGNLATKIGKRCKWGLLRESDGWGDGHCLVERESHDRELLLKLKQRENEWTIKDMEKFS